ncbi:hypothetical protein LBC_11080 [Campylobacter sp. 19-13652]|nr:hypothetical protein LBC_11080 [Campylobacter sp. 19-13652]
MGGDFATVARFLDKKEFKLKALYFFKYKINLNQSQKLKFYGLSQIKAPWVVTL